MPGSVALRISLIVSVLDLVATAQEFRIDVGGNLVSSR